MCDEEMAAARSPWRLEFCSSSVTESAYFPTPLPAWHLPPVGFLLGRALKVVHTECWCLT